MPASNAKPMTRSHFRARYAFNGQFVKDDSCVLASAYCVVPVKKI